MTELFDSSWLFRQEHMAGYISGGHYHGVEITSGADGRPVTRPMCLNLEHYYAKARSGELVPRLQGEARAEAAGPAVVRLAIDPVGEWRVHSTITYALLPTGVFEVTYEFAFDEEYPAFEALISNYFHEPTEPIIRVGGDWVQPQLGEREHRTWTRDEQAAVDRADGRLDPFLARYPDYALPTDEQRYDEPVIISPIRDSDWSVVHVIEREHCPSVSANRTWNAHDFSLVGRDVARGEKVVCRAWMAYAQLESLDDALTLIET